METNISTLTILAEVTTAFVAFAAIVASLRLTFGEKLSAFQRLLVHFFTECGMLFVSVALLPLVLMGFWQDESIITRITAVYALLASGTYFTFYVRRRSRIKTPTRLPNIPVTVGNGIWVPLLAITGMGFYWQPSFEIIAAFCYWGLFSVVWIFVSWLSSFMPVEESIS